MSGAALALVASFATIAVQADSAAAQDRRVIVQPAAEGVVPGEVLVGVRPGTDDAHVLNAVSASASAVGRQSVTRVSRIKIKQGVSIEAAIAELRRHPEVVWAEPNHVVHAASVPNDASYPAQWAPAKIQADRAWSIWNPQAQVILAIVDSGVDNTHPDLTNKIYRDAGGIVGYDAFTGARGDASDGYGHGTHVAGIAAAQVNNSIGVAGIAGWNGQAGASDTANVKIMPVRVLDNTGSGNDVTVSNGITWAVDHGARVISLSLGGSAYSSAMGSATAYAWSKGAIVVAAAGNSGVSSLFYPAANANVVSVAATDANDTLTSWSSWGTWVSVAAPGDSIYSTLPTYSTGGNFGINYGTLSGTSMATPHVAGEAALLFSQNPNLTNAQVSSLILNNVDAYNPISGHTIGAGAGRINVYKALVAAGGAPAPVTLTALTISPSSVTGGSASTGALTFSGGVPAGNGTVVLTTSSSAVTVPAGATASAGATTLSFAIATSAVSSVTSATITATYGASAFTATLTVNAPAASSANTASFVTFDTTTQGNWKGVYGGDGSITIADAINNPSYVLPVASGAATWTWSAGTADVRVLQCLTNSAARIAGCWYGEHTFVIDMPLSGGQPHQFALYCLDYDYVGRSERVDVLDGTTGALLDSRTITGFQPGKYVVWNLQGHVKFVVTCLSGMNAVVSGLFFGPAGSTTPPPTVPTITSLVLNPVSVAGGSSSTGTVTFSGAVPSGSGSVNLLSNNGAAIVATSVTASAGATTLTFSIATAIVGANTTATLTAAYNGSSKSAALTITAPTLPPSGGANSAAFVKLDTTTQGSWIGAYGAAGYSTAFDAVLLPSFATLAAAGASTWTWSASTSDVRAMQRAAYPATRAIGCWYSIHTFSMDVNLTDGLAHQVGFYCVDYDAQSRAQRIDIIDPSSGTVLSTLSLAGFTGGQYAVWSIKGHVTVKVTCTGGANGVVSGVFFD